MKVLHLAKYIFRSFILLGLLGSTAFAQPWAIVGKAGYSPGAVYNTSIAINHSNVPYVAFQDAANSYAITVMNYNGTSWNNTGSPGFTTANATYPTIAINNVDTPYVAYIDAVNNSHVSVMKFNGTKWVYVGSPGFSDSADYVSLAIGSNDTAYVALLDGKDSDRVTVMKYNGSNWVDVGPAGFSTSSDDISLTIDNNTGIPYVALDDLQGGGAVVVDYTGGKWNLVGATDFSPGVAEYLSLVVNKSSVPILGFQDGGNSDLASVMEYNGSNWINLGNADFSAGTASYTSLALDSAGVPFLAYEDAGNGSAATVAEYNGTNWVSVGSPGCTDGTAAYTNLAIDRHGRLYLAYQDGLQSSYASTVVYQHCAAGSPTIQAMVIGADTVCPGTFTYLSALGGFTYAWSTGDSVATVGALLKGNNQVYELYVTGIDFGGCASTDSIKVYTTTAPTVNITGNDTICNGSSTTLTASGASTYAWSTGDTTSGITVTPLVDSIFVVTGTAGNSCTAKDSVKVFVKSLPNIFITGTDTICQKGSTTLDASGGVSYVWSNGSTTSSISVSPTKNTVFTVTGKGLNGCAVTDTLTVYIDTNCTTGLDNIAFSAHFILYPNPAHTEVAIASTITLSNALVQISDALGRTISQTRIGELKSGNQFNIDVSALSNGLYFLRLSGAEGSAIYKIVKD